MSRGLGDVYKRQAQEKARSAAGTKRVAVIGAGAGGVAAARYMIAAGFEVTVFETGSHVGGLWVYENDNGRAQAYRRLSIISSRRYTRFADFDFDDQTPAFPTHWDMHRYIDAYARHFGVTDRIRFKTPVRSVEPAFVPGRQSPRWRLVLADGTSECMRAVREQLRRGATVIKVCASGGVLSEVDHPVHQQFTDAELRAIVEVAGLADRVVAAHCHGKPGIMAALRAGVATIEHGTYLDEEACDAMRETGTILVPTRTIIENILAHLDRVPPYAAAKLTAVADTHADMVRMAIELGVTIAMGTDLGLTGLDLPGAWGTNGTELPHLVALGMTPQQAIEAATATAPRTLGPQAPRSGLLAEGYDADLITVDGDPLADISLLADPDHITAVWVGGRQVKGRQ